MATSSATYLANVTEEFERLKAEQVRIFEMFGELASFQIRLAGFCTLSTHEEVYAKLLEVLSSTVHFSFARVLRLVEGSNRFQIDYAHLVPAVPEEALAVDESLLLWAIEKGQVSIYPVENERLRPYAASVIVVPLVGRKAVMGATVLWAAMRAEEMSRHVFGMLSIFSKEIAEAMENLDLYLRTQKLTYLLDTTIEAVPHAILVVGLDDRVISCNKNAEFLFGFKRFFALEERYQDVLPKELARTLSTLILSTLEGRIEIDQEMDYALDDRTRLTLGISSSLLTDKLGQPQGVLFICRDMSLSREVEKLRELDCMKTEFVHTVSHELKTPLTAILGGAEILMADRDRLDDDQKEVIGIIEEASRRLHMLLNDILDLSRLEDGEVRAERSWASLEEMVQSTAAMLINASPGHELAVEMDEDLPKMWLDQAKIYQALENIIGNAIKYSPDGGTIGVRVRRDGGCVKVSVTDQGIGIPADELGRIWDKFFRSQFAVKRQIEGTGLGLSIAKHIVELHDGDITVESKESRGSTFTICLPITHGPTET